MSDEVRSNVADADPVVGGVDLSSEESRFAPASPRIAALEEISPVGGLQPSVPASQAAGSGRGLSEVVNVRAHCEANLHTEPDQCERDSVTP